MIGVLHAIDVYLRVSENWVYPQIHCVHGVTPIVLCQTVENVNQFPLGKASIILDPPSWKQQLGIPRVLNSLAFRAGYPALAATRAVRRCKPDILHAHFGMRGWSMLPIRRRLGIPLVTSFYGIDAWALPKCNVIWLDRYRELFEQGDRFIAEGPAMGEQLKALGCAADKIQVVRIGVDLTEPRPPPRQLSSMSRVLMLARFTEKKGLIDGLQACLEARRRGGDLQVTIVGDSVPGDKAGLKIKAELEAIAEAPLLKGRVRFTGFLPAVKARELMHEHDIYLCPSKHAQNGDAEGGSPVSLTEAMALGLCCIGTQHCDIPEVIKHNETGLLAESGDIDGLASMLVKAIQNPDLVREMSQLGRDHIKVNFSMNAQVCELGKIYAAISKR